MELKDRVLPTPDREMFLGVGGPSGTSGRASSRVWGSKVRGSTVRAVQIADLTAA
jgi:hypothetical protein